VLKHIIFPGWAVPGECYKTLSPDFIADYGFFKAPDKNDINYIDSSLGLLLDDEFPRSILPQEDIILTAHSLGSLPALRATLICPNIQALVIISGFAKFTASPDYPNGKPEPGINMMQGMMGLSPSMVLSRFYKEMTRPSDYRVPTPYKTNNAELKQGLEYLKTLDLRAILSEINIPVTIIHGTEDAIVDLKLAEFLNKNIKSSTLHIIEGAGHALPFTHTKECLEILHNAKNI